ncbi:MAG: EAL domain-containing protein [Halothiobacillaceae bacterium]
MKARHLSLRAGLLGWLLAWTWSLPAAEPVSVEAPAADRPMIVAVLAYRSIESTLARWQPLVDYLSEQVPGHEFVLEALHLEEMAEAVRRREVDFLFTQPSHYVAMTFDAGLSAPLATVVNRELGEATDRFGGVIFVRANRSDLSTIADLAGRRVAIAGLNSLGAFQMQAFELLQHGVRRSDVDYVVTGQPQFNAIEAVLEGRVDAGFVRTGVLEGLAESGRLDPQQLRLIGAERHPDFPFLSSTRLYPEWPFVAMPHPPSELKRRVAAALLSLPHEGELARQLEIVGFTFPGDYRNIDNLLRALRLPPFNQPRELSVREVWQQWQLPLLGILGSVGLVLAGLLADMRRRNRVLHRAQIALQSSATEVHKLGLAVAQSPHSIMITDPVGTVEYVNAAFTRQTGYPEDEILGRTPAVLKSERTDPAVYEDLWKTLDAGETWRGEFVNRRRDGAEYVAAATLVPVREADGVVTHYLAITQDVTEQKTQHERIRKLAYFDPLTELPNRSLLIDRLGQSLVSEEGRAARHALILINIDRFKLINDARGNEVGDRLLRVVGQLLVERLPAACTVARMGADEFAVLLPGREADGRASVAALTLAEQISSMLAEDVMLDGESFALRASLGLTLFPEQSGETPVQVIQRADTALHRAKERGGHQVLFFEVGMDETASEQFRIERDLRLALGSDQFQLYLQPQVAHDGRLVGQEVLLRWRHPERGMISPGHFIPVAEQSDLIVALGRSVIEQSLALLARPENADADWSLSVNVSPRQFRQPGFVQELRELLAQSGVRPERLMLEITEGVFIDNPEIMCDRMQELTRLGLRFSIDDFGTGYSSMAYLRRLPIQEIKIDRAFVQGALENSETAALVEAMIMVAGRMDLLVVAEGVETQEQADYLWSLDRAIVQQGFLHGRPAPPPD